MYFEFDEFVASVVLLSILLFGLLFIIIITINVKTKIRGPDPKLQGYFKWSNDTDNDVMQNNSPQIVALNNIMNNKFANRNQQFY
jgi:hypothetical protein